MLGWPAAAAPQPIGFHGAAPVAVDEGAPFVLPPEAHAMVVGPTGCGKGVSSIVPALLSHQGPAVVIDPKGEAVAITRRAREAMGQRVIVLDPMRVTNGHSDAFNPLESIDPGAVDAVDEAAALLQTLAGPQAGLGREPFWILRAQHLLVGATLLVREQGESGDRSLCGVRRLIDTAAADPKALARRLASSSHPEAQQVANVLEVAADVTVGGIISVAQSMLEFLRGDQVAASVSRSTFDPDAITRGDPVTVYLVLPPHMLESHGRLLRLWLAAMMGCIVRRRARPAQATLMLLDECAALGELPQLRQALTLLRGYGLQTITYWQDLSQLRQVYPQDWQSMVNNCRVLQFFGAPNLAAAREISDVVGGVDAEALLKLPQGQVLLQLAGQLPVLARAPDYRRDAMYATRFDANPYHLKDAAISPAAAARRPVRRAPPARQRCAETDGPLPCPGMGAILAEVLREPADQAYTNSV
ncbi:MAG TPA: type IV secretory system conjugative DNA transfer family protein [Ramlibacter sp.]|nr:type IV secretory system conjugative DNA transfer family protein [Ramlibacter sp.]